MYNDFIRTDDIKYIFKLREYNNNIVIARSDVITPHRTNRVFIIKFDSRATSVNNIKYLDFIQMHAPRLYKCTILLHTLFEYNIVYILII